MGKLGGIILLSALALTGCAAGSVPAAHGPATVQPAELSESAKVANFVAKVQASGTAFADAPAADIAGMAKELCEHYAGGFTTEDLRKSDGDKLAAAGEAARLTVCPPR
jgi:hypothetical protein